MAQPTVEKELDKQPATLTSTAKAKAATKSKSKPSTRVPTPERYDMTRTEGPDPRDPRAQGYPCMGAHVPMPEGRGSLSGRNGHAMWKVCSTCRLRIQYTPAYGSKGTYRQAGPLSPDTDVALQQVGTTVENDVDARENLNSKVISVTGAQQSLKNKMKKLEEEKAKLTSSASRPSNTQVTEATKKSSKRENQKTAEQTEATKEDGFLLIKD